MNEFGKNQTQRAVTELLDKWKQGDQEAFREVIQRTYPELVRLAGRRMRGERRAVTLQTLDVVNEAYLKLADWAPPAFRSRAQFFAATGRIMFHILVDHARARGRRGRQADIIMEDLPGFAGISVGVLALDEALEWLAKENPRQAQVAGLRIFSGLGHQEAAEVLGWALNTVANDWTEARRKLQARLRLPTPEAQRRGCGTNA